MVTSKPLFGLTDHPRHLRYDWGEDLDEVLQDDSVCFTQCKRIDDIGQPAKLADVLWASRRNGCGRRWITVIASASVLLVAIRDFEVVSAKKMHEKRLDRFKRLLDTEPSPKSDRFLWQNDAADVGFEALFNALWNKLSFVYLDSTIITDDPAGVVLSSEAAARDLLLKWGACNQLDPKGSHRGSSLRYQREPHRVRSNE